MAADWRDPGLEGSLLGPLEKDDRGVWASEGLTYVLGFTEGDRITVNFAEAGKRVIDGTRVTLELVDMDTE